MYNKERERWRLYIDESGDHTFNNFTDAGKRYLALLGILFENKMDLKFDNDLKKFKDGIFGKKDKNQIIFNREYIINKRHSFGILREEEI